MTDDRLQPAGTNESHSFAGVLSEDSSPPWMPASEAVLFSRISWRLIPFLFVLYIAAFLDRVNVGFAALEMKSDLNFSDTVFGLGAGIFFLGYFLFEVPSNLLLQRIGARATICRIMVLWGLISSGMMFVRSEWAFYIMRFLLGVAEAGFFPGVILYLTWWFPSQQRARAIARFMTAIALSGVIGGPLSGLLLQMDGILGLHGWQWMFLLEGLPSVALGISVAFFLPDRPDEVTWLSKEEKQWLDWRLQQDRTPGPHHGSMKQGLTDSQIWSLAFPYFCLVTSLYAITLWLPELLKQFSGWNSLFIGLLSAVPYVAAAIAMVVVGASSDATGERRWHFIIPCWAGATGLILVAMFSHIPLAAFGALVLSAIGIWAAFGPFWTLPTSYLRGTAAAVGIALINSVGALGGFVGPFLIGWIKDLTHSFSPGLFLLAGLLFVGSFGILFIRIQRVPGTS